MLTVISGDPGCGKSGLAIAIAAALSNGHIPFSSASCSPQNTLYVTCENPAEYLLRPQFDLLKGNAERFFHLDGSLDGEGKHYSITLSDIEPIVESLRATEAKLLVIDPLSSVMDVDANRQELVKPLLDRLARVTEEHQCATLLIRHANKSTGGPSLYKGAGSIAISATARSELGLYIDRNDRSKRILAPVKSNLLDAWGKTLTFSKNEEGVMECIGEDDRSADDLSQWEERGKGPSATDKASDFISDYLGTAARPAKEVEAAAAAAGITKITLRRARERLKVVCQQNGFQAPSVWSLPLDHEHTGTPA